MIEEEKRMEDLGVNDIVGDYLANYQFATDLN